MAKKKEGSGPPPMGADEIRKHLDAFLVRDENPPPLTEVLPTPKKPPGPAERYRSQAINITSRVSTLAELIDAAVSDVDAADVAYGKLELSIKKGNKHADIKLLKDGTVEVAYFENEVQQGEAEIHLGLRRIATWFEAK